MPRSVPIVNPQLWCSGLNSLLVSLSRSCSLARDFAPATLLSYLRSARLPLYTIHTPRGSVIIKMASLRVNLMHAYTHAYSRTTCQLWTLNLGCFVPLDEVPSFQQLDGRHWIILRLFIPRETIVSRLPKSSNISRDFNVFFNFCCDSDGWFILASKYWSSRVQRSEVARRCRWVYAMWHMLKVLSYRYPRQEDKVDLDRVNRRRQETTRRYILPEWIMHNTSRVRIKSSVRAIAYALTKSYLCIFHWYWKNIIEQKWTNDWNETSFLSSFRFSALKFTQAPSQPFFFSLLFCSPSPCENPLQNFIFSPSEIIVNTDFGSFCNSFVVAGSQVYSLV